MRRVYVNLIPTLDLSNVQRIQRSKGGWCSFFHKHLIKECGCIDRGNATQLAQLDANIHAMNSILHSIASEWHARLHKEGRADMAVVTQPFMEGVGAELDWHFVNSFDCFHPSTQGHQDLAISLWNSMLCTGPGRAHRCGQSLQNISVTCATNSSVFYTGPDVVPGPPPK